MNDYIVSQISSDITANLGNIFTAVTFLGGNNFDHFSTNHFENMKKMQEVLACFEKLLMFAEDSEYVLLLLIHSSLDLMNLNLINLTNFFYKDDIYKLPYNRVITKNSKNNLRKNAKNILCYLVESQFLKYNPNQQQ